MSKRYRGGVISATPPTTTSGRSGVAKGVWSLQDQMQAVQAATWPTSPAAPAAPTSVSANANINLGATVTFTAPGDTGLGPITGYVVFASTGQTATGASSPIEITGLSAGVSVTFTVAAINSYGTGDRSAASNSVTPYSSGQVVYSSEGDYTWVAPAGVTSVSVIAVGAGGRGGSYYDAAAGGGGGGGGGLAYRNNITVTPGTSYSLRIPTRTSATGGGQQVASTLMTFGGTTVEAYSGQNGYDGGSGGAGGYPVSGTGGNGGNGGYGGGVPGSGGGGGAGGYSAAGGAGGSSSAGGSGSGGGGGGGGFYPNNYGGGGGGVGLLGAGSSGAGGTVVTSSSGIAGKGGSGGSDATGRTPGSYGGGGVGGNTFDYGGGNGPSYGALGAIRIIWPGTIRSFPSTNTGDM